MGVYHLLAEERLGKRHCGDENAGIEGSIALVTDIEVEDEFPRPGKDRCDGNWLGESYQC